MKVYKNGKLTVTDEGSKQGTFLNNAPIQAGTPVVLMPGDTIAFATFLFAVSQEPMEEAPEENPAQVLLAPALKGTEAAKEAHRQLRNQLLGKGDAYQVPCFPLFFPQPHPCCHWCRAGSGPRGEAGRQGSG